MPPADQNYTFNEGSNDDKELLARHGYRPGELSPEEERELLQDLHSEAGDDQDSEHLSGDVPMDERDGTE